MLGHNNGPEWPQNPGNWIAVSRDIRKHPIVGFNKPVTPADPSRGSASRNEAWMDLLFMAAYQPSQVVARGDVVLINVGQLVGARRFLAERWNWTDKTVRWFLTQLASEGMISMEMAAFESREKGEIRGPEKGHVRGPVELPLWTTEEGPHTTRGKSAPPSVITICNYRKYQILADAIEDYLRGPVPAVPSGNSNGQDKGHDKGQNKTNKQLSFSSSEYEDRLAETGVSAGEKGKRRRHNYDVGFVAFWASYPFVRGTSKPDAARAWAKLTSEEQQLAVDRLPALKAHEDERMRRSPSSTALHPATYLNQRRFETLGPEQNGKQSYWWQDPKKVAGLSPDQWCRLVRKHANGVWSVEAIGPTPASKQCVVPRDIIDQLGVGDVYDLGGNPLQGKSVSWAEEGH